MDICHISFCHGPSKQWLNKNSKANRCWRIQLGAFWVVTFCAIDHLPFEKSFNVLDHWWNRRIRVWQKSIFWFVYRKWFRKRTKCTLLTLHQKLDASHLIGWIRFGRTSCHSANNWYRYISRPTRKMWIFASRNPRVYLHVFLTTRRILGDNSLRYQILVGQNFPNGFNLTVRISSAYYFFWKHFLNHWLSRMWQATRSDEKQQLNVLWIERGEMEIHEAYEMQTSCAQRFVLFFFFVVALCERIKYTQTQKITTRRK